MPPFQQSFFNGYSSFKEWFGSARGGVGSIDQFESVLFPVRDTKAFERRFRQQELSQATLAGESAEFTIAVPDNEAWLIHVLQVLAGTVQDWVLTLTRFPPFSASFELARNRTNASIPTPLIQAAEASFGTSIKFFTKEKYMALPGDQFGILPVAVQGVDTTFLKLLYELVPIPAEYTVSRVITSEAV